MPDNSYEVKKYSRIKHNLALLEMFFTLVFLILIQLTGISTKIKLFAGQFSAKAVVEIAIYMLALGLIYNLFSFWIDFFSSYSLEHRFRLSRQNFLSWLADYFKKLLLGGLLYIILIEVLYFFIRKAPLAWWLWTALFWLFLNLFIARIFPVFIIPMFYKLEKLRDANLKNSLIDLAKKARIKIIDIYKIGLGAKTKKANAALTGLGSSKRVIFSDTLLEQYTPDEIKATLAHELAHHKYRHIWKLVFINLASTIAGFLLIHIFYKYAIAITVKLPIDNISAFPILAAMFACFNIIMIPISNAISRRFELQADAEAIHLTQNPEAFISLIEKLTRQNLSDPDPSKLVEIFFYDHPPASKRIKAVKQKK